METNDQRRKSRAPRTSLGHTESAPWRLMVLTAPLFFACSSQDLSSGVEPTASPVAAPSQSEAATLTNGADRRSPAGDVGSQSAAMKHAVTRTDAAVHYDISPPFKLLPPADLRPSGGAVPMKQLAPDPALFGRGPNPTLHTLGAPGPLALTAGVNFEGLGDSNMTVLTNPPDPTGAVGPSNYVQVVNMSIAVYDKTGTRTYGPVPTNTLWHGFGGACEAQNGGDGLVLYDRAADRWVISQITVEVPYLYCVAVSTTSDPTGSYARYAFDYNLFPDYPKMGVWSDAYYVSFNLWDKAGGTNYFGPEVCALERSKMLAGLAATRQCNFVDSTFRTLLPADLDSATPPPAGTPNPLVTIDAAAQTVDIFTFHVDFATPGNSTFAGPTALPVDTYFLPFDIPQPNDPTLLSAAAGTSMMRASYRNFGDHQALVFNNTIQTDTAEGVRWYEIRDPAGTPTIYQQGTYGPDSDNRWMGSAAINGRGAIALGYSVSSSTTFPSIRATGRLASDPLGTMPQGELSIFAGTGSQSSPRWGDYTNMTVDPVDDCTFWYTNQYQVTSGNTNWHTRIASFTVGSCSATNQAPAVNAGPDQTIALPSTATLAGTATDDGLPAPPMLTVTWSKVSGPGTVTFANSHALNTTATFSLAGTYVLQLSASDGALSSTDTVTIVVSPPPGPCSGICTNPTNFSINGSFQSGNLGTGARCFQTTQVVHGGNCGNFVSPRSLTVNGSTRPCNFQNWATVPPPRNGGYCIAVTPGNQSYAYVAAF